MKIRDKYLMEFLSDEIHRQRDAYAPLVREYIDDNPEGNLFYLSEHAINRYHERVDPYADPVKKFVPRQLQEKALRGNYGRIFHNGLVWAVKGTTVLSVWKEA